jgi:glycosyltransferase involved in cell wall biosynthesis
MRLSVVIPTYNRLARLQRVLAALEQQTASLAGTEVIVASDGSKDGTNDWLSDRAGSMPGSRLRLVPIIQQNQGVAAARNAGIACATGDIVLFIDDDVVPAPQLIEEHLATHAAEGEGVVVLGPMLTPADFDMQPWVRWEQAMLVKQYTDMVEGRWKPTPRQFYTGNTSLARRYLVESGGFDPAFRRAEDVELAYRLGARRLRFVFNAKAVGYHYAERSFNSWLQTPYLYGRNDVIFTRDKGQTWLLPTVFNEFVHYRKPLIRGLVKVCLDRSLAAKPAIEFMRFTAAAGNRLHVESLTRASYSGIFNLRYYQGTSDELGGRRAFFARVNAVAAPGFAAPEVPGSTSGR